MLYLLDIRHIDNVFTFIDSLLALLAPARKFSAHLYLSHHGLQALTSSPSKNSASSYLSAGKEVPYSSLKSSWASKGQHALAKKSGRSGYWARRSSTISHSSSSVTLVIFIMHPQPLDNPRSLCTTFRNPRQIPLEKLLLIY